MELHEMNLEQFTARACGEELDGIVIGRPLGQRVAGIVRLTLAWDAQRQAELARAVAALPADPPAAWDGKPLGARRYHWLIFKETGRPSIFEWLPLLQKWVAANRDLENPGWHRMFWVYGGPVEPFDGEPKPPDQKNPTDQPTK